MTKTTDSPTLAERLQPRLLREEQFRRTGRKLRKKSLLFKYERYWLRYLIKAGLFLTGLYKQGKRNALNVQVRHLHLSFPGLPAAFDGYTILHLSDLHIDGVPGLTGQLEQLLPTVPADLCVVTGDYRFDDRGTCAHVYPLMQRIIGSMRARDGLFGTLGNHDVAEIAIHLDPMGLRMLVNESLEIRRGQQSIWLTGLDDDFDYRCDDLPGALQGVPPKAFKVLLAHTPELYSEAEAAGIHLYLCGHTHGGQICFPKIGSLRNNVHCPKEYARGPWLHAGLQGYTSFGVGCSTLPVRYNCLPEVVMLHLHRGLADAARVIQQERTDIEGTPALPAAS